MAGIPGSVRRDTDPGMKSGPDTPLCAWVRQLHLFSGHVDRSISELGGQIGQKTALAADGQRRSTSDLGLKSFFFLLDLMFPFFML